MDVAPWLFQTNDTIGSRFCANVKSVEVNAIDFRMPGKEVWETQITKVWEVDEQRDITESHYQTFNDLRSLLFFC